MDDTAHGILRKSHNYVWLITTKKRLWEIAFIDDDRDYFTPPNTGSSISSSHLNTSFDINIWSLILLPVIKVG